MKKETKKFIGTIAGALVGSAVFNINYITTVVRDLTSPTVANLVPFVGLIIGGVVGYYVAKNS